MRADEVELELMDLFGGNADGGEFAEAGVDAVGGLACGEEIVNDSAGGFHAGDSVGGEGNRFAAESDGVELREGEVVAGQEDH